MNRTKSNSSEKIAHQIVYRTIAAAKDKRYALSNVRLNNKNHLYPAIAKSFSNYPQLKEVFAVSEFPSFDKIRKIPRIVLANCTLEDELIWLASVLSTYTDKLDLFVKIKNEYNENVYTKNLESALKNLEEIENQFGYSLWLVRSKIYCINFLYGIEKQEEYVENLIENGCYQNEFELHFILNYSDLIKDNNEYDEYKESIFEIYRNLNIDLDNIVHQVYRLAPDEIISSENYAKILHQEENRTIIDRYETYLYCLYCCVSKGIIDVSFIKRLKKIFKIEGEKILNNCYCFSEDVVDLKKYEFLSYNEYTKGNYEWFIKNDSENINLVASALANIDKNLEENNIKNSIINSVKNIFNNVNQKKELNFLKKHLAMNFGSYYSYQILNILSLLEKDVKEKFDDIIFLYDNPKSFIRMSVFKNLKIPSDIFDENISIKLLESLRLNDGEILLNIKEDIPENRYNNYYGLIKFQNKEYDESIKFFNKNIISTNNYIKRQAMVNLFNAYLEIKDNVKILDFFAEEIMDNGFIDNRINALKFFRDNYENLSLRPLINFSIFVDYLKKNKLIDPIFDLNLADLLDYVLMDLGIDSPLEILDVYDGKISNSIVYYLKNICTLNTIDSLMIYEELDDVELLRIQICQKLVDHDPDNSKTYRSEIAQITKSLEVNRLFECVETGRIFVDTESLKSILFENVSRGLEKCKEVLKTPDSDRTQKLKEILNNLFVGQYPQLKNVYLPKNDLESFYFNIVRNVINEFFSNPAYGLDTHVSTAIRHGWFEGYFTKPFVENYIYFEVNQGEYFINDYWKNILGLLDTKFGKDLARDLIACNKKVNETVKSYVNKKLQFDNLDGSEKNSLFNQFWSKEQHDQVSEFIKEDTLTEELFEKIFSVCWSNLESDLAIIRNDIDHSADQIIGQLDRITQKIVSSENRNQLSDHLSKIIQARESFHEKIQTIKNWFHISSDYGIESFQITHAVSVCIKQIDNCFGSGKPRIICADKSDYLNGKYFEGICKILFLLIQNAIIHNNFEEDDVLNLDLSIYGNCLSITSKNYISRDKDLHVLRDQLVIAHTNLTVNRACLEGGSGLSKIKVITEFDFKKQFDITLDVSDDYLFTVSILIKDINDLHN